jgi:hypothetical protein
VIADVVNPGRILEAIDSLYIHLTKEGGIINKEGTPFPPYTPNFTPAAYGPGTPVPTQLLASPLPWMMTPTLAARTSIPSPVTNLTATQFVPLAATSTPLASPYPLPPYP